MKFFHRLKEKNEFDAIFPYVIPLATQFITVPYDFIYFVLTQFYS